MSGDQTISVTHALGFETLSQMAPEALTSLTNRLRQGPVFLAPAKLVEVLRDFVEDQSAAAVADALLGVAYIARETQPASQVAPLVCQYLRDSGWDDRKVAAFERVSEGVAVIASLWTMTALSKSVELGFAHSLLFARAHVLTDSRPIYSADRDAIHGAIISQTLRLEFRRNGALENIDVALDQSDLIALRDQCELALKKAATLQAYFAHPAPIPTTIVGEP